MCQHGFASQTHDSVVDRSRIGLRRRPTGHWLAPCGLVNLALVVQHSHLLRIRRERQHWADGASRVLTDDPWAKENQFELQEIPCAALDTTPLLQRVVHFAAQIGGGLYADVRVALRQLEAA